MAILFILGRLTVSDLMGVAMALSNGFGLLVIAVTLGFGLVCFFSFK